MPRSRKQALPIGSVRIRALEQKITEQGYMKPIDGAPCWDGGGKELLCGLVPLVAPSSQRLTSLLK